VAVVAGRYREIEMVGLAAAACCPPARMHPLLVHHRSRNAPRFGGALPASSLGIFRLAGGLCALARPPCSSRLGCTLATAGFLRRRACACASTSRRPRTSGTASWRPPSAAWSAWAAEVRRCCCGAAGRRVAPRRLCLPPR
jgi:hypothetical protein